MTNKTYPVVGLELVPVCRSFVLISLVSGDDFKMDFLSTVDALKVVVNFNNVVCLLFFQVHFLSFKIARQSTKMTQTSGLSTDELQVTVLIFIIIILFVRFCYFNLF